LRLAVLVLGIALLTAGVIAIGSRVGQDDRTLRRSG